LIALALALVVASVAHAQPAPIASSPGDPPASDGAAPLAPDAPPPAPAPAPPPAETAADTAPDSDMGDQDIAAQLGIAAGSHLTPGGLRIAGHYLYQLSERDWFDGMAAFTFGSGRAACFHDRENALVCDHGLTDGTGVEVSASIRRMFTAQGAFRPYARLGIGLGAVHFSDDAVTGVAIPIHAGGGVRVKVSPSVAVVGEAELSLGFGNFNHDIGSTLEFGFAITAGAEFRLR
jgi:opacity protein-like surface antigen